MDCYDLLNPDSSHCACGTMFKFESFSKGYYKILGKYCKSCYKASNELKESYKTHGNKRLGNLAAWSVESRNKRNKTNIERHGSTNVMSNDEVKSKIKNTLISRYNTSSPFIATDNGKAAWKEGYLKSKTDKTKALQANTNLLKYGVKTPLVISTVRTKLYDVKHDALLNRINKIAPNLELIGQLNRFDEKSKWKCISCNAIFNKAPDNGSTPRCFNCDGANSQQGNLFRFLQKILSNGTEIIQNSRKIISPLELDIHIPEKRIAIEYNGVYWHAGKDKNYHLKKTKDCLSQKINLIHIFEDEWLLKQDIWKSMLTVKLGVANSINGRSCTVSKINSNISNSFLEIHHLRGFVPAKLHVGLFYNTELVGVCSLGKPRYSKEAELEILRVAFSFNTRIHGGFSKMLSYVKREFNPTSMLSYVDRTLGEGSAYELIGFEKIRETPPGYFYIKDYKRWHRSSFQKHKLHKLLVNFDESLTESENMKNHNYLKLFDCGNNVYIWNK